MKRTKYIKISVAWLIQNINYVFQKYEEIYAYPYNIYCSEI
jgi:hypothetical protein